MVRGYFRELLETIPAIFLAALGVRDLGFVFDPVGRSPICNSKIAEGSANSSLALTIGRVRPIHVLVNVATAAGTYPRSSERGYIKSVVATVARR